MTSRSLTSQTCWKFHTAKIKPILTKMQTQSLERFCKSSAMHPSITPDQRKVWFNSYHLPGRDQDHISNFLELPHCFVPCVLIWPDIPSDLMSPHTKITGWPLEYEPLPHTSYVTLSHCLPFQSSVCLYVKWGGAVSLSQQLSGVMQTEPHPHGAWHLQSARYIQITYKPGWGVSQPYFYFKR